jgi:general secretion pathway protein D
MLTGSDKIRSKAKRPQSGLLLFLMLCVLAAGCSEKQNNIVSSPEREEIVKTAAGGDVIIVDPQPNKEIFTPIPEETFITAQAYLGEVEPENNEQPATITEEVVGATEPAPKIRRISVPQVVSEPNGQEPNVTIGGFTAEPNETESRFESLEQLPVLSSPELADELISVNFNQVDIRMMLKTIGDITGINFVVDDNVQGTVTVMSPTRIRLGEIYKVLESVLEVKGYAAVPAGNLVKIVPRTEAAKKNLLVRIGADPSQIPSDDSVVTQIIPLSFADAEEVSQIVKPLLTTGSHLATYPRTNSILITDTSSNIHHVAKIIKRLDVEGSKEQVTVVALEFASAEVLSEQITEIMQKSKAASKANRSGSSEIKTDTRIVPDTRTNSLIVVANAQDTAAIERVAAGLDVQRPNRANNVHVVYLKNAPAKEVARSLTDALINLRSVGVLEAGQKVQVTADEGTNALIITASAQDYEVIREITEKLDIVREQVLVEMLIMEVTEETLEEIGIDWATLDQAVTGSVRVFGQTNFSPRTNFSAGTLEGLSIGTWRKSGSTTNIGSIITALEKKTGVNILSTPHITTSNHSKAKIIVGENRPYVTESRITESDPATPTVIKTYEYKDVGISLELTPHISQAGLVRLEIESEFTKLVESTSSSETPTTAKRQAQTVISMQSGSTVVIGGLIRDDITTLNKKVPLLGDIPLIGELFKYKKDQLEKTNLLIFITPYILSSQEDMNSIKERKTQEMKKASEGLDISKRD